MGCRLRAALRQHPDNVEIVEGEDQRQHDIDDHHVADRRQRDVEEPAHRAGAIERCSFDLALIDILQRRQIDQHGEGKALPHRCNDHRRHGHAAIGKPGDAVVDQADLQKQRIYQAKLRIVHEAPEDGGDHTRQDEGQKHDGPQHALHRKLLIEKKRRQETEDVLQQHDAERPDDRIQQNRIERAVGKNALVERETDELRIGIQKAGFVKALVDSAEHRIIEHDRHHDEGGSKKQPV